MVDFGYGCGCDGGVGRYFGCLSVGDGPCGLGVGGGRGPSCNNNKNTSKINVLVCAIFLFSRIYFFTPELT